MITPSVLRTVAWLLACLAGLLSVAFFSRRMLLAVPHRAPSETTTLALPSVPSSLDSLSDEIIEHNPFRLDRSPALVAFGQPDQPSVLAPPKTARPQAPIVSALFGGQPWHAVLENVPGVEHAVIVSRGMRAGPFLVLAVSAAGVRLSSGDTTWQLRLRGQ